MKNTEKADKLFLEVEKIYTEMQNAYTKKYWNLTIRRAQEIVELTLKCLLFQFGVDYPKVHDVAPVFKQTLEKKKIVVISKQNKFLQWLLKFSAKLSIMRAPAFYYEAEYEKADAKEAVEGVDKIIKFAKKIFIAWRTLGVQT